MFGDFIIETIQEHRKALMQQSRQAEEARVLEETSVREDHVTAGKELRNTSFAEGTRSPLQPPRPKLQEPLCVAREQERRRLPSEVGST